MSVYNHFLLQKTSQGNRLNPSGLYLNGPMLNVVLALIDTGATKSCVHEAIMEELKVSPIGVITSHTAAGAKQCSLYPAHFTFCLNRFLFTMANWGFILWHYDRR